MDCVYLEKISLLIDDKLSASEAKEVKKHIARCAECARAEKSFLALRGQIKSIQPIRNETAEKKVLREILREGERVEKKQSGLFFPLRPAIAVAVLLIVCVVGIFHYTRLPQKSWEVTSLEGQPKIGSDVFGEKHPLKIGEWLETNDSSRARIAVADIGAVEVEPETRIRLVETNSNEHRLEMTRGSITAQINAPPRLFFVNTPSATVIDYGCAYSLNVDEDGASVLHVTEGWVSLALNGRESLVPASAYAKSRKGFGPGTPYFEDASGEFTVALTSFDFENGGSQAINIILDQSRRRDALSLWYLLERTSESDRARVFERLSSFVPLPENTTREGVLALDRKMLDLWKESIDVVSVGDSLGEANQTNNSGKLVSAGNMNLPRAAHTTTVLTNGKVLIAGGLQKEGDILKESEIYDAAAGKFLPTGQMNTARAGHTAMLLANGKVLITGGADDLGNPLSSAEIYDPATGVFSKVADLQVARSNHQATRLSDGKVLITGGRGAKETALSDAEIFDAEKNIFFSVGKMNSPRVFHTATLLSDGTVLLAGGNTGKFSPETTLAEAEIFNPAMQSFTPIGKMTEKRYSHAATLLQDGRVLITGGSTGREWKGRTASAEIYDPTRKTFDKTAEMSLPRFNHQSATALLLDGRVIIAGAGARVEIFDPASNSFNSTMGNVGTGRIFSTATVLSDGSVLITGGYNLGYPPTASAWLYRYI